MLYLRHVNNIINELENKNLEKFNEALLLNKKFKLWDSEGDPAKNLFFWSVLSMRIEIAQLFWILGNVSF